MTEGLLPAGEETSTVDGTLEPIGTREELTAASDRLFGAASRTMVVEQSSGEETVTSSMRVGQQPSVEAEPATSRMLPAERPSGEVHAADIASDLDSVIGAYPPVDRSSTEEHETDDVLTEPRHTSKTPSEYRSSTETGTEEAVHVMITIAGGAYC